MEVIIERRGDYLFVGVSGQYNEKRLIKLVQELAERCKTESCQKLLADFRTHTGAEKAGTLELYSLGEMVAKAFPSGCRVAVVIRPERLASAKFMETVAQNRGSTFRLFTEITEAEQWL